MGILLDKHVIGWFVACAGMVMTCFAASIPYGLTAALFLGGIWLGIIGMTVYNLKD